MLPLLTSFLMMQLECLSKFLNDETWMLVSLFSVIISLCLSIVWDEKSILLLSTFYICLLFLMMQLECLSRYFLWSLVCVLSIVCDFATSERWRWETDSANYQHSMLVNWKKWAIEGLKMIISSVCLPGNAIWIDHQYTTDWMLVVWF